MLKKIFIKEYERFILYGIYLNDKLIYRTTESKITDKYTTRALKTLKADVQIMILQLIMIYSEKDSEIKNKFWGAIDYKILRLKERLKK